MADGTQQGADFGQDPSSYGMAPVPQTFGYGAVPQPSFGGFQGVAAAGAPGMPGFSAGGPTADGSVAAFPGAEALTFEQQQQQLQQYQQYYQWCDYRVLVPRLPAPHTPARGRYQQMYAQQQQAAQLPGAFAQPGAYGAQFQQYQMPGAAAVFQTQAKNKIFVGGLPYNLSEAELVSVFAKYNAIQANIIVDRETGQSRGFGFVAFNDEATANEVMRTMNGIVIGGRSIRVGPATKRSM